MGLHVTIASIPGAGRTRSGDACEHRQFGSVHVAALAISGHMIWDVNLGDTEVAAEPRQRYQNYSQLTYDLEHPDKVEPFFAPDTPLLVRNPRLFWQLLAALLAALNLLQLFLRK